MSPSERKLFDFIAARLESMFRRPAVWGTNESVEEQVLQLLEIRRLLLDPACPATGTRSLMQRYVRFIATVIPDATPQSLAIQLARHGREAEFTIIMKQFADLEQAAAMARVRPAPRAKHQPIEFN